MTSASVSPSVKLSLYPSTDGEPVAETYVHLYAMLITLEVLRQYLVGQQATVLSNQFLYYAAGFPKLRVAPDVMVIFDVEPGGRDNYKIWEEGQTPTVIFEMTSKGTQEQDQSFKKTLYEQLDVQEYWLFDPKGEWISEKLRGYCLQGEQYVSITDNISHALKLRLAVEDTLISFYRLDTDEKLLIPDELATALAESNAQLAESTTQLEAERQRRADLEAELDRYRQQFGDLPG
ncbi:MAG: Uma2 family endonuclease [Leptolyngbya sp. SIO1D8]|nr:Uma2 family endonuclease [Leptolyngbya sp. SIO1D8]